MEDALRRVGRARRRDDPVRGLRVWNLPSSGDAPAPNGRLELRVGVAVALHEASLDRRAVETLARDLDPGLALPAREGAEPARRDGLWVLALVTRLEPDVRRAGEAPIGDRSVLHWGGHPAVGAGEVGHLTGCRPFG